MAFFFEIIKPRRLFQCRYHLFSSTSSTAADHYLRLLYSDSAEPNLELLLSRSSFSFPLSPSTFNIVLRNLISSSSSSYSSSIAALRFFLWSSSFGGLHHSAATISSLSKNIRSNSLHQLLDFYKTNNNRSFFLSLNSFKLILLISSSFQDSLSILRRMPEFDCRPDVACYNSVLRNKCSADEALALVEEMLDERLQPNTVTVTLVIRACQSGRFAAARNLVDRMQVHGCVPGVVVYSALIDCACQCGDLVAARQILDEMEREGSRSCAPNVVTYTCLIKCYCKNGRLNDALELLDRMRKRGCVVNRATVATLLSGLCAEGRLNGAFDLIELVIGDGSVTSEVCYSLLVICLLRAGKSKKVEEMLARMLAVGVLPDGLACNSFMRELCSKRLFLDCYHWFKEMGGRGMMGFDSDTCSSLLAGLCQEGCPSEIIAIARRMVEERISLEDDVAEFVINSLKKLGEDDLASQLSNIGRLSESYMATSS